ncbi:hypothetical protein [Xiashengella succiniciproducens]|jgi:hypothetical protein|uniref:Uncharacterized protein n=1 Tax=Xiashengella succiniciproducens TaxID=2949635 RepID=A0A9J6ZM61_9BACT|nr:hypothetical protein [Alkaliflexus sp. Ai-910]URW78567.1 hypothetical protein M9189_06780 [Alkaliflexus sp. Ai-910]
MDNFYSRRISIAHLNKKGRKLRALFLKLTDEELKSMFPAPPQKLVDEIRKKTIFRDSIHSFLN